MGVCCLYRDRQLGGTVEVVNEALMIEVVGAQNFSSETLTYVVVIAVIGLAVLIPIAGELGKQTEASPTARS